jgi:hypothetical protein
MMTKVQNWRTTEVLKLRDWFCWTFLALILLDLFSLEHTLESFVTSFDLCLWICMQLIPTYLPTYLPTHWQFHWAFHNPTTWTFNLNIGIESHHHLSNLLVLTFLPTHQSNKDKLRMIWLNEYEGWTMQWVGSQSVVGSECTQYP